MLACTNAVAAVDGEQRGVERTVVERIQYEGVLWMLSEVGMLTSREDMSSSRPDVRRAVIPGQPDAEMPWGWPTVDGLLELVAAGKVTRLGPVDPD